MLGICQFTNCNKNLEDTDSLDILNLLLERDLQSVRETRENGHLPIHLAARNNPPEFCKVLIDAYPDSVRIATGSGLPIHIASYCGRFDTVEYLFELYPESINVEPGRDFSQFTPQLLGKGMLKLSDFCYQKIMMVHQRLLPILKSLAVAFGVRYHLCKSQYGASSV